jgi:predicted TIM-barrel fold metal-dependent hydrolase
MNGWTVTYSQMFSSKRLLIVEDEYFLAAEAGRELRKLGAILIGPIDNIPHALELIESRQVDAAILDLRLDADLAFPIAEALEELGLPYVFATGHNPPVAFTGFILCDKAVEIEHIAKALFSGRRENL